MTDAELATILAAWEHVNELREAWRTGALSECDGQGGTRSNRNVEVEVSLRKILQNRSTHQWLHGVCTKCGASKRGWHPDWCRPITPTGPRAGRENVIDLKEIERQIFVDEYGEKSAKCQEEVDRLENELADARQRLMWAKSLGKAVSAK